jgi:hypothetical protein
MSEKPEMIMRAAIQWKGRVYHYPIPARHHNVISRMAKIGFGPEAMHDQGFLTSEGRFVDRVEGLTIAKAAEQIQQKHGNVNELYSEDIW